MRARGRPGGNGGGMTCVCVAALCLGACSLAPRYERPPAPVEASWPDHVLPEGYLPAGEGLAAPSSRLAADIGWKHFFSDAHMRELIALALANNRDLRVTALNIERARALYRIQRAEQLPGVSATGEESAQSAPGVLSTTGERAVSHQYSVGAGLSDWELDFFGRVQSLKEAALEDYLASEEALNSARLSLVAATAAAYLNLAADRERLEITRGTLENQQASYEMIRRRRELGVSSELDLWQAQTSVDAARVDIARYTSRTARDLTALSTLVGVRISPEMLPARTLGELPMSTDIPAGLSSSVLLRRPDILQAEHLLKAANATIGAARANFFPRITLTAFAGTAGPELSDLFDGGTGLWRFTPRIQLPLFEGGRSIARLKVAETDKAIAVAAYEKAIQTAFQEVSDALILRATLARELKAQESLTHAATQAYNLSRERYRLGIDSYLAVLDSQRFMYSSQQNLITVRLNRELNQILLYKTLGGGWTADDAPATPEAESLPSGKAAGNTDEEE